MTTRIILPLITFFIFLAAAITTAIVPFIPEWEIFQNLTCYLSLTGGLAACIWLIRGVWMQAKEIMKPSFRTILTLSSGFVGAAVWLTSSFVCLVAMHGFLFSPNYLKQAEFPEYNTTIYVYDNSFLDPEALIYVRQGWLPLMHQVGNFGGVSAADIEISQNGEWAVCDVFQLNLSTGAVVR